jgi:hypothetical protein
MPTKISSRNISAAKSPSALNVVSRSGVSHTMTTSKLENFSFPSVSGVDAVRCGYLRKIDNK